MENQVISVSNPYLTEQGLQPIISTEPQAYEVINKTFPHKEPVLTLDQISHFKSLLLNNQWAQYIKESSVLKTREWHRFLSTANVNDMTTIFRFIAKHDDRNRDPTIKQAFSPFLVDDAPVVIAKEKCDAFSAHLVTKNLP